MPRDSSGNYSLPAGYLAAPNTPGLSEAQHNGPLQDIAQAITESMPSDARIAFSAPASGPTATAASHYVPKSQVESIAAALTAGTEGTWSPGLRRAGGSAIAPTTSQTAGFYQRVGNWVHVTGKVRVEGSILNDVETTLNVTGLPLALRPALTTSLELNIGITAWGANGDVKTFSEFGGSINPASTEVILYSRGHKEINSLLTEGVLARSSSSAIIVLINGSYPV